MIARRFTSSLLLPALLISAARAGQIPAASPDSKEVLPPALQAGATKSPVTTTKAAPTNASPATTKPAQPAPTASPVSANPLPSVTPANSTDSAAVKPGILSAAKAKGPPPAGKAPAPAAPLSPRFQQVRMKMSALFDTRNLPAAPTDPLSNPFRPAGAVPVAPIVGVEGNLPAAPTVNNDLASLQQAVATLRVKGTIQRGKNLQLTITSAPGKEGTYKEGDIINVVLPNSDPVHVRVRQVSKNSVTLTLGDAEMVLKF